MDETLLAAWFASAEGAGLPNGETVEVLVDRMIELAGGQPELPALMLSAAAVELQRRAGMNGYAEHVRQLREALQLFSRFQDRATLTIAETRLLSEGLGVLSAAVGKLETPF